MSRNAYSRAGRRRPLSAARSKYGRRRCSTVMPRRRSVWARPFAPEGPVRKVERRSSSRSRPGADNAPHSATSTRTVTPPMTTARSPRRMEPEPRRLRVEALPSLGIARHAAEHVVIQARDQGCELGPACGVEPSLHGVFRRGLRRVESQQVPTVEGGHGGGGTLGQGFSESSAGAEALRLPQMPRGAPRGSRFGGRRDDGLTRSERAPHNPGHVSEYGEQQERQGGEEQIVARGRRDPQGLEPLEEPVPRFGQAVPGATGLGPAALSKLEDDPQLIATGVALGLRGTDA